MGKPDVPRVTDLREDLVVLNATIAEWKKRGDANRLQAETARLDRLIAQIETEKAELVKQYEEAPGRIARLQERKARAELLLKMETDPRIREFLKLRERINASMPNVRE